MSGAGPRLSVVTVCRNALPRLAPTADSVLDQSCAELEYVVVDGASTDGTVEYLATLAGHGVRVVSEPDRGVAHAMNKGIELASGEWLAHLHAGDELLPGALELVDRALRVTSADVVCAPILKAEEGCETVYRPHPANLPLDMTVHHPGVWTRRAVLQAAGGFDESYALAMDYELFLRLFVAGHRFDVMAEPVARMAGAGISERSAWATLRETHLARRRLLDRGLSRSHPYLLYLVLRLSTRRTLQRAGLGRLVAWYRRRFALAPKS